MKDPREEKNFTSGEVMALVEDLKSEFRAVAEGVTSLDERMCGLEEDVQTLKDDMTVIKSDLVLIKDAVHLAIPSLNNRLKKLETKIG